MGRNFWLNNLKAKGLDPFCSLLELVRQNNTVEVLKEALGVKDMKGAEKHEVEETGIADMDNMYTTE